MRKPVTRYPRRAEPTRANRVWTDADIVRTFRATGRGWQKRMSDALRTYLKEHPL
jgi:uncharacterized protein (DUF4415 family)